jgi:hypothetical protein
VRSVGISIAVTVELNRSCTPNASARKCGTRQTASGGLTASSVGRGVEPQLYAERFGQEVRDAADRFRRVDGEFGRAVERALQPLRVDGRESLNGFCRREVFAPHAQTGRAGRELAEHRVFVGLVDGVERPALRGPHAGLRLQFEPAVAAAQRADVICTRRLTDRPDHAEVADRSALRARRALEQDDGSAAPRGLPREREPHDAAAHDGDIDPICVGPHG